MGSGYHWHPPVRHGDEALVARLLCEVLDVRQTAVAARLGVTRQRVCNQLHGRCAVDPRTVQTILAIFLEREGNA